MKTPKRMNLTFIFSLVWLLICPIAGWAQSEKTTNAGTSISTAKKAPQSSTEELRNYKADSQNQSTNELRYSLLQVKSRLETGVADKSLTPQQINDLKAKISTLEGRIKNQGSTPRERVAVNNAPKRIAPQNQASQRNPVHNIYITKQCTRAQFLALTEAEQRQVLVDLKDLAITDLVSATSVPKAYSENVYYITEDNFRNSDIMKQVYMLNNPSNYKIVTNGTVMPKAQITKAQLNTLPADRQKAIMESNQYEITN